jgi:hypothetical protein
VKKWPLMVLLFASIVAAAVYWNNGPAKNVSETEAKDIAAQFGVTHSELGWTVKDATLNPSQVWVVSMTNQSEQMKVMVDSHSGQVVNSETTAG